MWSLFAAWTGTAIYVLGWDGLIPSAWPLVLVLYITWRLYRLVQKHKNAPPIAANTSQKPSAAPGSSES